MGGTSLRRIEARGRLLDRRFETQILKRPSAGPIFSSATDRGCGRHRLVEVDYLPGHNSSYKRDVLLGYGDRLESMMESETVLHWDLRAKGHRLYLSRQREWRT